MSALRTGLKIAAIGGLTTLLASSALATTIQQLPSGARAGECYGRTTTPAVYRTVRDTVAQPPRVSWREIPAVYKAVSRQVQVTPGRTDYERVPEVTGTRVHWVEHPGLDRVVEVPTVYRWVEQRVLISPARLVWRRGTSSAGYGEGGYGEGVSVRPTGEVMCRVLIPARYEVRRVRVLVTAARTCIEKGAVTRERVVEHFVVRPARAIPHPVAPIYRTVSERILVTPARRDRIEIPQPPRYVERRVEVTPTRTGWTRIACKAPVVPVRYAQPTPPLPPPHRRAGQCHTHTVCEDTPEPTQGYTPEYAQPRPVELDGAPQAQRYRAPTSR